MNPWPMCNECGATADRHWLGRSPGLFYCENPNGSARRRREAMTSTTFDAETWMQLSILVGRPSSAAGADAALAARREPGDDSDTQLELL